MAIWRGNKGDCSPSSAPCRSCVRSPAGPAVVHDKGLQHRDVLSRPWRVMAPPRSPTSVWQGPDRQ